MGSEGGALMTIGCLEIKATQIDSVLIKAYLTSCPLKDKMMFHDISWNSRLAKLITWVRKLFNKAKLIICRCEYRRALTEYNLELKNISEGLVDFLQWG